MSANTVVVNSLNTSAMLQTINIVSASDVVDNFDGTYTYGAVDFSSPQVVPASGDYIVISQSGANELMKAAVYNANYNAIGAAADQIAALAGTLTGSVDGTMVDVAAAAGACAGGATPSATQVDTAIATAVAALVTSTNLQLKELMVKVNQLVAAG